MKVESDAYCENGKYYEYHQDSGHTTTECRNLTKDIGQIKTSTEGPLPASAPRPAIIPTGDRTPKVEPDEPEVGDIFAISGGDLLDPKIHGGPPLHHRHNKNGTGKKRKSAEESPLRHLFRTSFVVLLSSCLWCNG